MNSVQVFEEVPFETLLSNSAFGPRFSGDCYAHDGAIATLRTTDLDNDGNLNYEGMPLANLDESKFKKHFLNEGDLVISRSGTVGIASVFKGFHKPVLPGAFLIRFTLKERSDPQFYRYFFNSPSGRERVLSIATGAVQQNINITNMKTLKVPSPPLSFQKVAVQKLEAFDNLIENNNRRIAILEEMAQSLYREWFVKFRFPGHDQCQMVESPLGLIPEGWEVVTLKEFCSQVIDGTHDSPNPTDDGYPLVTGKHIKGGTIDFSSTYQISEADHLKVMARSRPEQGDILFTNIGTLGSACLVDQPFEYSIKNIALFKPREHHQSYYLYLFMTSRNTISQMLNQASGTSQKFLSLTFLRKFNVVSPSDESLEKFHQTVKPIFELKKNLQIKNSNLKKQRDLLLPKLISGQIDLSQAEQASA